MREGKLENLEINARNKAKTKINPTYPVHMAPGRNRTWATFVRGERSQHCVVPASSSRETEHHLPVILAMKGFCGNILAHDSIIKRFLGFVHT